MLEIQDQLRLLNKDRDLIAVLSDWTSFDYERRLNQATPFSVSIPLTDQHRGDLEVAYYVEVVRGERSMFVGKISTREIGIQTVTATGYSEEIELERAITPPQYGLIFSGMDLVEVAAELAYDRAVVRVKDQSEWVTRLQSSSIDFTTEPGLVILDKLGDAYRPDGFIVMRFDANDIPNFTSWERVRWASDNDHPVYTTMQYRWGNDTGSMSSYTPAVNGVLTDEIGVVLAATTQRYLDVRIDLSTEDTETDGIGYSPALYALEVIAKTRQIVDISGLGGLTGETVNGLAADSQSHLAVLQAACEQLGYEFKVDQGVLYLDEELSTDRSSAFVLRSNQNIEIRALSDTDSELINVLFAYGPGNGINRQQIVLEDSASIAKYGRYPGRQEFSATTTLAELETAAQEFLDGHSELRQAYQVDAMFSWGTEPEVEIGDLVTLVDPNSGIISEVRLLGLVRNVSADGTTIQLDLGTTAKSLVDAILDDLDPDRGTRLGLAVPVGLRAAPANPGIAVSVNPYVNSRAVGVEVHMAEGAGFEPSTRTLVGRGQSTSYLVNGLITGARYYFKARSYDDRGEYSAFTSEVSTLAGGVSIDDLGPGTLDISKFAQGIRPPRIGAALPELPDPTNWLVGDLFMLVVNDPEISEFATVLFTAIDTNDDGFADDWRPTLTAEQLAGQISAGQITANSITSAQIAAGAIGATEIAADQIKAHHIDAGQVQAQHIAANAIHAGHITVADFSNMAQNPTFEDEDDSGQANSWIGNVIPIELSLLSAQPAETAGRVYVSSTQKQSVRAEKWVPVNPGEELFVGAHVRRVGANATTYIGWEFTTVAGGMTFFPAFNLSESTAGFWREYTGQVKVPSWAAMGRPKIEVLARSPASGYWEYTKLFTRPAVGTRMLVDGTIELTNADRSDSALSVKTGIGAEVLRLGNITGRSGVPAGTNYGLWGRLGAGVFIEGVPRVLAQDTLTTVYEGPPMTHLGAVSARRINQNGATQSFAYTVPAGRIVVPLGVMQGWRAANARWLSENVSLFAQYAGLTVKELFVLGQIRVGSNWIRGWANPGQVVTGFRVSVNAVILTDGLSATVEPHLSVTSYLQLLEVSQSTQLFYPMGMS